LVNPANAGLRYANPAYALALLDTTFNDLTVHPLMGRDCSDIRLGYRKVRIGKHLVFYRQIESEEIEIVHVLHERMDVEQHFLES
jgi:toxin ParE1/3/4